MSTPRVSVLLPVHNAGVFLETAITSIFDQEFRDWELVVVDDGSTDGSTEWLRGATFRDSRLRLFRQDKAGLVTALNRAVSGAQGELLARMDADDVARKERLGRQVAYLDAHPSVGVLGSSVMRIGAAKGYWEWPSDDASLKASLLFQTPFAHPSVMFRRLTWAMLEEGYREAYLAAEDIDLWERLVSHTRFSNLKEPLLEYRIHGGQVTQTAKPAMAKNGARVRTRFLGRFNLEPSIDQQRIHESIAWLDPQLDLTTAEQWLLSLQKANQESGFLNTTALDRVLARRWFELCGAHSKKGLSAWKSYRRSSFARKDPSSKRRQFRFGLICVLRQISRGRRYG